MEKVKACAICRMMMMMIAMNSKAKRIDDIPDSLSQLKYRSM